jgi:muramoyltetrapeptide carboxypeptidase
VDIAEVKSLPHRHGLLLPRKIRPDSHIRIVSPSWPSIYYTPYRTARAEQAMTDFGFTFSYGRHAAEVTDDGGSAGTAEQRAQDVMEAFTDENADVILSAAGGGTTREILPLLDADVIRASRKPFIGYCDNVWLNQYLLENGLCSYYGIAYVAHFGEPGGLYPEISAQLRAVLLSHDEIVCSSASRRTNQYFNWQDQKMEQRVRIRNVRGGCDWIREGEGRGRFIGGGVDGLPNLIDHFSLDLDGAVLFWDVGPSTLQPLPYLLKEIARRADLTRLAGMVVGANIRSRPERWAATVAEALDEVIGEIGYPVMVNADIGHLDPPWVTPYGMDAVLDSQVGLCFPRDEFDCAELSTASLPPPGEPA